MTLSFQNSPRITVAVVPTNIALIKYWGKQDAKTQWPANSSLSMTLKDAKTTTKVCRSVSSRDVLILNGNEHFSAKMFSFLSFLKDHLNFSGALHIDTENSFPSSCGIASSASGYACLTLAAAAYVTEASDWKSLEAAGFTRERLANIARLGSGSACRSFVGGFVLWDRGTSPDSQTIKKILTPLILSDTVVIVSPEKKSVSSSEGHERAWGSPLFKERLGKIDKRLEEIKNFLDVGNFKAFGELLEEDAEEMHSVMETSEPATFYRTQETHELLHWVKALRGNGLSVYATVDAGPNVHLITKAEDQNLLVRELSNKFPQFALIVDHMGSDEDIMFHHENP